MYAAERVKPPVPMKLEDKKVEEVGQSVKA
jgi:hypothetical protein